MRPARSRFRAPEGTRGPAACGAQLRHPAAQCQAEKALSPHTLGLISIVRKSRKQACGTRIRLLLQLHQPARRQVDVLQHHPPAGREEDAASHLWPESLGTRASWETAKAAYLPDFTAVICALSAWLKPSVEPGNRQLKGQQADLDSNAPTVKSQGGTDSCPYRWQWM